MALALVLRSLRLSFQPLWWDEGYSVWFAHQPLPEMLRLTAEDIHPPLYYAGLSGWSRLFGLAPVALRLFSVLVGVLTVALIYPVGRWLGGRRAGLLAAALLAISPFHIFYSQEVRMYALVALWGVLALGAAGRGLDVRSPRPTAPPGPAAADVRLGWLAGYVIAMTLALYTQYYAGFLAAGLTLAGLWVLWRRRARLGQIGLWLLAQGVVALLTLPWLLYATPRLVAYVSQKVVADSDQPLGLLAYLTRHLAAFGVGHVESPLTAWWPLGLLLLIPLAWSWLRLARTPADRRPAGLVEVIAFLGIALATLATLGWLVNLSFPFFPERGERLLLLGLPVFILLVAVSVTGAAWGARAETGPARRADGRRLPLTTAVLAAGLAAMSLTAFYTAPRYEGEDYRPLIGQVTQWGRPGDTVFAVYPWQVGYFWSYGHPDGPQPALSPDTAWSPAVAQALDEALARGHVWFPEHLSLGGILETAAEDALTRQGYLLANRWYSSSTRLTGFAGPPASERPHTGPAQFAGGLSLADVAFGPDTVTAANDVLFLDLAWQDATDAPRIVSARLVGPDQRSWAQQDYTLTGPAQIDRIGLLVPSGTPPGPYTVALSLRREPGGAAWDVLGSDGRPQGTELSVGTVTVAAPDSAPSLATLPVAQSTAATLDDAVRLLGFSASSSPLAPGEDLQINLFWQALPGLARTGEWAAFVQLLDGEGAVVAGWEGPPVAWHPTTSWQEGELVRAQHTLRLPATVTDGEYQLITGLFDPASGRRLRLAGGLLAGSRDFISLGQVTVRGREHVLTPPQPAVALEAELARVGRLTGFDLGSPSVAPGQSLDLMLHWQAKETTGDRLAVFVHLVAADGSLVAQADGEPGGGAWPTSSWVPGEFLADTHTLTVQPGAAAGPATLVVGLYDPLTGERVPWLDAAGQPAGDELRLPVTVMVGAP